MPQDVARTPELPKKPLIFISFSPDDELWRSKVVQQLSVLEEENLLTIWDGLCIEAGQNRIEEIENSIEEAELVVLLISARFLTSEHILRDELPLILERTANGLRLMPVLVEPCTWQEVSWLKDLAIRPRDREPLSARSEHEIGRELTEIVLEVRRSVCPEERQNVRKRVEDRPKQQDFARVEIRIDMRFEDFSSLHRKLLRHGLADFLEIDPKDIQVISTEPGSVRVTVELPAKAVEKLLGAWRRDKSIPTLSLHQLPVVEIKDSREKGLQGTDTPEDQLQDLYFKHNRRLYRFFKKRGLSTDDCLDLVRETFTEVLLSRRSLKLDTEQQQITSLFAIATNTWRREMRARERARQRPESPSSLPSNDESPAVSRSGDAPREVQRDLFRESLKELEAALDELPPRMRRAMQMYVSGRKISDIARTLRTTPSSAWIQVSRAYRQLEENPSATETSRASKEKPSKPN